MIRAAVGPRAGHASARPVVLTVVRHDGSVAAARPKPQRPVWWALYGIGLLTVGGVWAAEVVLLEGPLRILMELLALFGGVALTRIWLGWNRWQLAQAERQAGATIPAQNEDGSSVREAG